MATLYDFAFTTFINLLKTQQGLLEKAEAYAAEKGIDVSELLEARLAPDMWPASQQITISCLHASNAIVKLAGGEANNVPFGPGMFRRLQQYASYIQARRLTEIFLFPPQNSLPTRLQVVPSNRHLFPRGRQGRARQ